MNPRLAPAELPASPRRRWWQRRRPWQATPAQLIAARSLALEVRCALTCAQNYRDADHVAHRGTAIRDWLTGAPNEEYMAGRYSAARQVLANVGGGSQRSPSPAEFVEAAARFARFVLAA